MLDILFDFFKDLDWIKNSKAPIWTKLSALACFLMTWLWQMFSVFTQKGWWLRDIHEAISSTNESRIFHLSVNKVVDKHQLWWSPQRSPFDQLPLMKLIPKVGLLMRLIFSASARDRYSLKLKQPVPKSSAEGKITIFRQNIRRNVYLLLGLCQIHLLKITSNLI